MFLPVSELQWEFLGFQAFVAGIPALAESEILFTIPWLANIIYIVNLLLRNKNISIRITISVFTVVFSLLAFGYFRLPFQELRMFEAYIGPGLIFWILSFILMLASQIKEYKSPKTMKKF
jgi:hypothetical protein